MQSVKNVCAKRYLHSSTAEKSQTKKTIQRLNSDYVNIINELAKHINIAKRQLQWQITCYGNLLPLRYVLLKFKISNQIAQNNNKALWNNGKKQTGRHTIISTKDTC